jgi:single-stranded-DNA-specific exonuclease
MSARKKVWKLRPQPDAAELAASTYSPLLTTLLHQRGLSTGDAVDRFLTADYRRGLHDPFALRDMPQAAARVAEAIDREELIGVYGDFDADGITAVTLLVQAIGAMGGRIRPYVPHRVREGYGLNHVAIETLARDGVRLLITVDCGISNVDEVAEAARLGLDVIVTDHHNPPETLPAALAVVNPRRPDCGYPFKGLVGVGVAFKLVQALIRLRGLHGTLRGRDLLDVVALGTVADMGPLVDENRVLVKAGLEALNSTQRPGLTALLRSAGLTAGRVDSSAVGFSLAPRLNAAGRLTDAERAYRLLLTDDAGEADLLAAELSETNRERQQLTTTVQLAAEAQIRSGQLSNRRILVLADEQFAAGVVGLVAARLVEEYGRPAVVIERGAELAKGSARSVPGYSIIDALRAQQELFERYGGHPAAAGFTIRSERIPLLAERLEAAVAHLTPADLAPALQIDAEVPLTAIDWPLQQDIARLEPFGAGNPQPLLLFRAVTAQNIGTSRDGATLRAQLRSAGTVIDAVGFRLGHLAEALRSAPTIDLVGELSVNEWNGRRQLQLFIRDFRRPRQGV